MIRAGADIGDFDVETDVCIIGSGAGGGVAAAVFAEAGRDVIVLEEGPHVPAARMTQREEQMYPLIYRDGGNQMTTDGAISVLQGRVVGGSTVVNMADVVEVPDGVLQHWAQQFGVDRYSVDRVREADRACLQAIGANRIVEALVNRNGSLLLEGGAKLGMSGGRFVNNRVGCVGSGYCLVGCAYDAKRSVALTWLPRALNTGRTLVQSDARVERLSWRNGRVTAAVGQLLDETSHRPIGRFTVRARHFVLAAGAIHSPVILQASGLGAGQAGKHLSLQPQVPVTALFADEVVLFRGIPQSTYLDSDETHTAAAGLDGYRLEAVSATPGQAAATTSLPVEQLHTFMQRYRHVAACLCLVPDRPTGTVSRDTNGRARIDYPMSKSVDGALRQAMASAARVYLAAGAQAVYLPLPDSQPISTEAGIQQAFDLPMKLGSTPMISAHPQGTCRMGPDGSKSVVGLDLFVHGFDNLQVLDASVFPTTASSHTMLPVMSFAWLAANDAA